MKIKSYYDYNHPYHLVTNRPWPLLISFTIFIVIIGRIKIFLLINTNLIILGTFNLLLISYQWWRDIVRERTFQGIHNKKIYKILKIGMFLFILSEVIFFVSFFWSYLHCSLSPRIEIGVIWPPKNIEQFNPYNIPLLNTIILLSSGVTITWCHHIILYNKKINRLIRIFFTVILGLIFSFIQMYEYKESLFRFNDSVYGSLFYIITGFHGLHVLIGTLFLIVTLNRMFINHLSIYHHFGFERASWYWHFVDVIWIIVYSIIYWWNY